MEALHEQEEGGLKQFLERRPKLFEVTRVAGVLRAKLRHQLKGNESSSAAARTCSSADHWASSIPVEPSSGRNRTKVGTKKVPEHVYKTYPRFCIPFSAMLLHHSSPPSEQSEPQNVVEPNASSFSIAIPSDSGQQDNAARLWSQLKEDAPFLRIIRLYNPEDNLEVQFARTFVNVLPEFAAGKLTEADQTYERYEVEPYEWFRIARVSPFTRTFLVVTPTVLQEASQLLPPNRDPVHVWASAPELFEITIGDGDQGELGMLCVRYILHPSYMATGENKTEEEIIRQLEELSGPTQRTKKKRRRLRRALQCLQEPLSFLDDRVWAHFIFDSLPESGSATAEKVVSMLPEAYKNCTPVQWRSTLQKFPMLFKVYDGPVDLVIQRADLPVMQMRPLQDITAEEILQEIYKAYPLRFHPVIGVTISQMLTKLPRSITQRLYTMENVELELLLPFQDKVEILRDHTFFIEQQGGPPVYSACGRLRVPFKSRPEMLLQVRGREDFLIGFRFVGEWQERLLEKFTKRCQKYDCDPETTSFLPIPV